MQMPSKKTLIIAGVLVASHLGAFAVGRFATPERVVEKEKIVYKDKVVEKIVEVIVERTDEKKVAELQEQIRQLNLEKEHFHKNVKKTERIIKLADGSIDITRTYDSTETRVVEKEKIVEVVKEVKVVEEKVVEKIVDRVVEKVVTVEKIVEKEKIVENAKRWRLAPMVGLDIKSTIAGSPTVLYGGEVGYRFAGPFGAGLWGLSNGTAGVSVSIQF